MGRAGRVTPGLRARFGRSCPRVTRQIVGEKHPRNSILNPRMVLRRNRFGLIETANRHIDFLRLRRGLECQLSATSRAKRAPAPSPLQLTRLTSSEAELDPAKRSPTQERCSGAAAAIGAVTMGNVIRPAGRLVTHCPAQATTANDAHGLVNCQLSGLVLC